MAIQDKALQGKVALVTGASQGIGKAIAIALGKRGAKVIVNFLPDANGSTREADAKAVAAEVDAAGGQGAISGFDVSECDTRTHRRSARRQTVRARCSHAAMEDPPGRMNCVSSGSAVSRSVGVLLFLIPCVERLM